MKKFFTLLSRARAIAAAVALVAVVPASGSEAVAPAWQARTEGGSEARVAAGQVAAGQVAGQAGTEGSDARAAELIESLAAHFRAMGPYRATFTVAMGGEEATGSYAVSGERYRIRVGDAEVAGEGAVRYEIDRSRREVTVVGRDAAARNLVDDPVHAFETLARDYDAVMVSEDARRAVVRLMPRDAKGGAEEASRRGEDDGSRRGRGDAPNEAEDRAGNAPSAEAPLAGGVTVEIDTRTMRPVELVYDFDGDRIAIRLEGIAPLQQPLPAFDRAACEGYEWIDFR